MIASLSVLPPVSASQAVFNLSAVNLVVKFLPVCAIAAPALPAAPLIAPPTLLAAPLRVSMIPSLSVRASTNANTRLTPASVKRTPPRGLPRLSFNAQ